MHRVFRTSSLLPPPLGGRSLCLLTLVRFACIFLVLTSVCPVVSPPQSWGAWLL